MVAVLSLIVILVSLATPANAQEPADHDRLLALCGPQPLCVLPSQTKPDLVAVANKIIKLCQVEKEYVGECDLEKRLDRLKKGLADLHPVWRTPSPNQRGVIPIPPYIYPTPIYPTPQTRLETLRRDLARLRTTYTDRHPDVILLKSEIEALEREIAGGDSPGHQIIPVR